MNKDLKIIVTFLVSVVVFILVGGITASVVISNMNVYTSRLAGQAAYAHSVSERKVLVSQAEAELEAAKLRAEAIKIVGEMAKQFPGIS